MNPNEPFHGGTGGWQSGNQPPQQPWGQPPQGPPSYPPPPGGQWQVPGQPGPWNAPQPYLTPGGPKPPNNKKPVIIGGTVVGVLILLLVIVLAVSKVFGGGDDKADRSSATGTTGAQTSTSTSSPRSTPATSTSKEPPGANGGTVSSSDLQSFLLSADEIGETLQTSGMTAGPVGTSLVTESVTPPECVGIWVPGAESTFSGSGNTDVAIQTVQGTDHHVVQALILFPDAATAKTAFDKQYTEWKACGFKTLNATYDGLGTDTVKTAGVGNDQEDNSILASIFTDISGRSDAINCDRASALRANVIIDMRGCSRDDPTAARSLAHDISRKITGKR